MPRLRTLALSSLVLWLALPTLGCPKQEEKKESAASDDQKADDKSKKKKGDDDDDDDKSDKKKKTKKKSDDDDDDKSKSAEDQSAVTDDTTNAPHGVDDAGPSGPPIPGACAPDSAGRLGAKPKLVASAGEPGVSLGVWAKNGETPLSNVAITLHADGRCYVDYLTFNAPDPGMQWLGYEFPKGSIGAAIGTSERGSHSVVGFRVNVVQPQKTPTGQIHTQTYTRFYGYESQDGQPYSCGAIPGEKGCAMYQRPLLAKTGEGCTDAKGGGPIDPLAQVKIAAPPPIGLGSKKPNVGSIVVDAGAAADAGACNGPTCTTNAILIKQNEHIYVSVSAGKPMACDTAMGAPHVGDTWYFEESSWKKR